MWNQLKSFSFLLLFFPMSLMAQEKTAEKKENNTSSNPNNRPKDHLLLQLGTVQWLNRPDTISTGGFSRSFSAYLMLDLAFKTDPRFSVGIGAGIGSDHVFFDKNAGRDLIINRPGGFQFNKNEGAAANIRYKSMKLHTAYLEAPVELRFMQRPDQPGKSFKAAIGMKVGTMISAVEKTRFERDEEGAGNYTMKIKDRRNFNNLRLAAMARVGYGPISVFVQYQLNELIKQGQGPADIRPLLVGITLSGL